MKGVVILILIILNSALVLGQEAEFSLDQKVHKFSDAVQGDTLEHTFKVTNTGDAPLIITDYKVSCPCTKALLPEAPIAPGASFDLKITFTTEGKYGPQDRKILLMTNTKKEIETVRFKVEVLVPE